jgi:hypothetical protein
MDIDVSMLQLLDSEEETAVGLVRCEVTCTYSCGGTTCRSTCFGITCGYTCSSSCGATIIIA